jgi:pimeloyl-ACP methyl ester carboxylesterase
MSTTGDPAVGQATPEAMAALMAPAPKNRDEAIANGVAAGRILSPVHFDEAKSAKRAGESYDRAYDPKGVARQMGAIGTQADRTERLGSITVPSLVIHGRPDPLVTLSGGEATAKAIPNATLLVLDEMGHDNPEPLWPTIVDAIVTNARKSS